MKMVGKILIASAIVLLVVGSIGLPTTLGYYGQMHGQQNHMMQTTTGQCQYRAGYVNQGICQNGNINCQNGATNCSGLANHGMMDDDGFRSGGWYNTTVCNSATD